MERKPLSFPLTITISNVSGSNKGNGSITTPINSAIADAGGYMRQLIIDPPNVDATYDVIMKNSNGRTIFKRTEQVGDLADDINTPMPADTYTVYLENCSHNGVYNLEIIYAEVY